ncbi:putative ABC transporter ATP-binding protein [Jeotgalibaca dankookensis]|uniref:Putative ABC transporter ATP-binding protein n=1 Tax=Jeotgalibaca dankookensis TaxID=708126 RepID=A0A1S6IMV8_9LACT|nr:ABC transporter ATP-binding protein [Jeotgalibaca dankookensis]AQS52896.1 putative ABC transporter ATP-binding protein [Jeotgalibaca dankookensis]
MSLIWKYVKRYKLVLLLNVIGSFGFVFVELGLPTMLANLINGTIAGIGQSQIRNVIIWMLAFTFFGFFGRSLVAYATSRLTTNMIAEMRNDLFSKIQTFSHEEFDRLGVSSLVTRVTNDAFILMQFSQMVLRLGVSTILMLFASFYMIFQTSRSLSIVLIPAFPFLLISVLIIGKLSRPLSEAQQKNLDNINLTLRESLTGLRVIRAFVREKFQSARFSVVNEAYSTVSRRLFYLMAWTQPLFSHVINLIIIAIVWMGSDLLETGDLQIGTMVAYIEYSFFALYSFLNFAIVFMMYPRAAVSAGRIQEVFDTVSSIDSNEMGIQGTKTHGFIQFENVSFSYPDNKGTPVIENINFSAGPGQTIAFIGSTGSGKSTIMQLIPRFYDVTGGRIIMDGYDLRDYNLKALRQKIGYIPQKSLLFTGSIADNLRYGKFNATHGEMEEASDISQATDFILDKAEKFEEHLSEGGSNLSGGQKQRLSIARAVVRRPDFYIFDDSFSALDYKTDQQLRNRLKKETLHATVIIVAQRVSSILHADKIIVLNEGRVVGEGTHRELLKTNKIYYDIASSQLREEELA